MMVATARRAAPGNAANSSPSMTKTSPSAARKSDIGVPPGSAGLFFCRFLGRLVSSSWGRARGLRCRRGPLAGRIAEIFEEIGIRPQHQAGIVGAQAGLVGLHRAVEGKEVGILAIGIGEDAGALG